jgi:hypothetical protein
VRLSHPRGGISRRRLLAGAAGATAPDPSVPSLPVVSLQDPTVVNECAPTLAQATGNELIGVGNVPPYPPPTTQVMPSQEPGAARRVGVAFGVRSATASSHHRIKLVVQTPGPGRVAVTARLASGRLFGRTSAQSSGAGSITLTVAARPQALRTLRGGRRREIPVAITFAPKSCGPAQTLRTPLTVR